MRLNLRLFALLAVGLVAGAVPPAMAFDLNVGKLLDATKEFAKSQGIGSMSEADEIAIGREVAAGTLGAYPPIRSDFLQRYVNEVGLWVALRSERPNLPWRFAAVESAEINAFAVPGGTVLVTGGMLQLIDNEAELACVLGHEIGHIVRKHHLALLQKGNMIGTGASLLADQVRGSGTAGQAKRFVIGQGGEIFTRSLDRGAERDADLDAVLLAARAGYDPAACSAFMHRLAALKAEPGALEMLYKTHPQASERVESIDRALARLEGAQPGSGARPAVPSGK